jgi:hypothetical protein
MTENGAQRAQAARAGRTVSACAFVGGGVMLTLNFLFGREAGFPGGAVGGAIGAAVGGVVGIGINKLKSKSERTPKLGFLGWAFSGGLFCGQVPGSNLGGIGAAFIGAGAIPAFRAINTYPNAPMVLIGSLVLGCGFLAGGYGRYCSVRDSKTDQEDKDAMRKVRVPDLQPMSTSPNSPSGTTEAPVSVRTFEEAKTELERRNYKVIAPFFVANQVRVRRPDGGEESLPNRLYLPTWASKELGVTDQPMSASPNSPSALPTPVSIRTFEEAKTELERRNYKVIAPFFVANQVRVQRPDGSEELVPNRLYLPAWASKELGVTDQPNNGRASPLSVTE